MASDRCVRYAARQSVVSCVLAEVNKDEADLELQRAAGDLR
jgi:hypothetical protein